MDLQHLENNIGTGSAPTTGTSMNSSDFQRLTQTIATSLQKIQQNVTKMQRMINQCNTPQDSPEHKKEILQMITHTQQLVSDTDNQLKELEKYKERHGKMQRDRLIDEFTAALTAYQAVQRKMADMERNLVRQTRANQLLTIPPYVNKNVSTNGGINGFFDDNIFNRRSQQQQQHQQQQDQQIQIQEEQDLQALEEQEKAIVQLEKNIASVNEIYKNLGAVVYEHGNLINTIESAVDQTSVFVAQGTESLRKSCSYKNKLRRRKIIFCSIIGVFLTIIILLFYFQLRN